MWIERLMSLLLGSRGGEVSELPKIETTKMALYHFEGCPFCMMVRGAIDQLGLDIELRDIRLDRQNYSDLVDGGGSQTVPCLRMELPDGTTHWQYESRDIVAYLKENFG